MIIRYLGHAFFTLTMENGTVIAMDPYDELYQYPQRRIPADIVTMSHHHYDHDGIQAITSESKRIHTAGVHNFHGQGIVITGIPTFHDHHQGEQNQFCLQQVSEAVWKAPRNTSRARGLSFQYPKQDLCRRQQKRQQREEEVCICQRGEGSRDQAPDPQMLLR